MKVLACIVQDHDLGLVLVGALICATACFTALSLLARAAAATGKLRQLWLASAGLAFGCGVWATHFIAMLAFQPNLPVGYSIPETMGSLLLAAAGAWLAFGIRLHSGERARAGSLVAGTVLGSSIGAMHFVGMSALRVPAEITFDPVYVTASIGLGIGFCIPGLVHSCSEHRPARVVLGALLLLLAVCSLHFTAMGAVTLLPLPASEPDAMVMAPRLLAAAVACGAALILLLSLAGSIVDQHLCGRATQESQRLAQLADASFEGIVIHDSGTIIAANRAFCDLLKYSDPTPLLGSHVTELVPPEYLDQIWDRLRNPSDSVSELCVTAADGTNRPVEIFSRPIEYAGKQVRVVAIRDLSARKEAERRILHLAHHDSLTGLANRYLFNDRLTQAMAIAKRKEEAVAVLCLDLDGFKAINDLFGHPVGDALLKQVAARLKATARASDTVARLGGDEFAVIQNRLDTPDGTALLASRLVAVLAEPYEVNGHHVVIGASVGVAIFPVDGRNPDELLCNADTALYRAKQDGRGAFRFFEREMNERLHKRLSLERELRAALSRNELELQYQPLYRCNGSEIVGFEALLRWNHPRLGQVPPAEFIPLAEETGLIVPIGRWVLHEACMEATSWPEHVKVSVNLSPAQFWTSDLPAMVADMLELSGLNPRRLELEVTEGLLIGDTKQALEAMAALKDLGVSLALDDFGTGYSSLSYLQLFPFDKIKIDRSFVETLERDPQKMAIVRAILALGRSLNVQITAEGVETPGQLAMLRAEACDQVQGYLLGRPMGPGLVGDVLSTPRAARHRPERLLERV